VDCSFVLMRILCLLVGLVIVTAASNAESDDNSQSLIHHKQTSLRGLSNGGVDALVGG
jgi:hypothetical protein